MLTEKLNNTLKSFKEFETKFNNLEKSILEHNHAGEEEEEQQEEEEEEQELIAETVSLNIYGSSDYLNGVFSVNNSGFNWRSGFRTTDQYIQHPGEYFEWKTDGIHICGITRTPLKNESWKNTEYAFYFLDNNRYLIFIDSTRQDYRTIRNKESLRIAIDADNKIAWQIVYSDGKIDTVWTSDNKVEEKYYLYASLPINTQISGIQIVKTQ